MNPTAELAVRDVLLDYCEHVDAGDVDAVIALFSQNSTVDYGHGRLVTGHEELRTFYGDRLIGTYAATSHHVSNMRIAIDEAGTTATARSYIYAFHRRHDGSVAHVWGRYGDRLVLEGSTWRIAHRTIRAVGATGFPGADSPTGPFEGMARVTMPEQS